MEQVTYQALPGFTNLTSLDIRNLHVDINQITKSIASILIASPAIESLSLSLAQSSVLKCARAHNADCDRFFFDVVGFYATQGGQQMRLRKLALGFGVRCYDDVENYPTVGVNFQKFIHLEDLQELCINNPSFDIDGRVVHSEVAYINESFPPRVCTNLGRLSLDRLTESVGKWCKQLVTPGPKQVYLKSMERNYRSDGGDRLWLGGNIRPPNGTNIKGLEDFWKPYNSSSANMLNMLTLGKSAWENLDASSLPTVKHLQALSIDTSYHSFYIVSKLLDWIGRLKYLEQLSIYASNPTTNSGGVFGRPGIRLNAAQSKKLAHDIVTVNKTLRFVKIEKCAWRVHYEIDDNEEVTPRLEQLDRFETREIQAFTTDSDPFDLF